MKRLTWGLASLLALAPLSVQAASQTWSLDDALRAALASQPRLAQAQANLALSNARVAQAEAPGRGQLNVSSGANVTPLSTGGSNADLPSVGLSASYLLTDFGQTQGRIRAAQAQAQGDRQGIETARQAIALDVRSNYFSAQAARAMVDVAREGVTNQQHHLDQIQRFVQIGMRAPIDLALARRDMADARLQLIQAQGNDAVAKARLIQATGQDRPADFHVAPGLFPPVAGEQVSLDQLWEEAQRQRPDLLALQQQREAQVASVRVQELGSWPQLRASAGLDAGGHGTGLPAGSSLGLSLTWPLWDGGSTRAQVKQAEAGVAQVDAQIQALEQQVRAEIEQARQAVLTGREAVEAAAESTRAAREQLTLAEGRYDAGVGSAIELSDAQLGLFRSRGQEAQQAQQLSTARAQLLEALGRDR